MSIGHTIRKMIPKSVRLTLIEVLEGSLRKEIAQSQNIQAARLNRYVRLLAGELSSNNMTKHEGLLERCNAQVISGWAWDCYRPEKPVRVEIWDGESRLDTIEADRFRLDLFGSGMGDGRHGFLYPIPQKLRDGRRHRIHACIAEANGTVFELGNSPVWLEPTAKGVPRLSVEERRRLDAELRKEDVYAQPQAVTDLDECFFYHAIDLPGYGTVPGPWDLRGKAGEYLGNVEFKGKRVLEIGTASGFLCFYMESQGAEVVAYDLSENDAWDVVPYAGWDYRHEITNSKEHIRRINNGYWLAHRALTSSARVMHGNVYNVPGDIGLVDVAVLSSVLLHVRGPFLALQNALRLTLEKVIIVERVPEEDRYNLKGPYARFLPEPSLTDPTETWWVLSPEVLKKFIGVLGFDDVEITYHTQVWKGATIPLFTLVGQRTRPLQP